MRIDLEAAAEFMAAHARLVDRRRFDVFVRDGSADALLSALDGYRNADGGYGWGLEPDLRSMTSQPASALHAFEVFEDIAPLTSDRARELCDWLGEVTLPDGGMPFAHPIPDPAGSAPFWVHADSTRSSPQITSIVVVMAHRVARHDPTVAAHPWLARGTAYCLAAIEQMDAGTHAMALAFATQLLDVMHDTDIAASALLEHLATLVPRDGKVHVGGGLDDEFMRPLDFAPDPNGAARALIDPDAIAEDLRRVETGQQADGGWRVEFASYSPAATLEWRGHATIHALSLLRRNRVI